MTIAILIAIGFLLSTPRVAACVFASIYLASGPILFACGERIDADVPGLWPVSGKQGRSRVNTEPAP